MTTPGTTAEPPVGATPTLHPVLRPLSVGALMVLVLAMLLPGLPALADTSTVDGVSVSGPDEVVVGQSITVTGTGWTVGDGSSGSVVAMKLDEGGESRTFDLADPVKGTSLGNKTIWAVVEAQADGSFSATFDMPDGTNNASGAAWKAGETHTVRFLSGSMKTGDVIRTMSVDLTVTDEPELVIEDGGVVAGPVTDVPRHASVPEGQEKVVGQEEALVKGLYQTAYSAKNNAIFATSAQGRPPVKESTLVKLDADSLAVQTSIKAPVDPTATGNAEGGRIAFYGVAVDDANGTVWVTNTRQNTVAVYKQSDLSLVKQFPAGAVPHSRDVVIDPSTGKAFVSSSNTEKLYVFDTTTLEATGEVSLGDSPEDFTTMSLDLDPATHKLYTLSLSTPEIAVLDTETLSERVITLPEGTVDRASGVAYDPATKRIFVASQGTGNLVVVDEASGDVINDVPRGEVTTGEDGSTTTSGALNVAFDPVNKLAYVANRTAGTITVHDVDGDLVTTLDAGANSNHVLADGRGHVYAVNKGGSRPADDDRDLLQKFSIAPVTSFTDVPAGMQFHDEIMYAASQKYVTGWDDGTYRPLQPVNRDAMAAFLYRMAGEPVVELPASSPFVDVKPTDEHYQAIVWAYQQGIAKGWSDGTFRPTTPIARDAMAAFVYRYAGSPDTQAPTASPFSDITTTNQFATEIAWLKGEGITTGYPDGTYRPLGAMNRDAMAAFMYRMDTDGITYQG